MRRLYKAMNNATQTYCNNFFAEIFITTAEKWSDAIHLYPLGTQLLMYCVVDC